jgi:primosomal protein N' (replication factor Y)
VAAGSPALVADLVFDLPLRRSFSYRVPPGLALRPGQRVAARLQGRLRVGVVVAVGPEGGAAGAPASLAAIERVLEPAPLVGPAGLELARWAAAESLSSLGATLAAWLPPPPRAAPAAVAPPGASPSRQPATTELWCGPGRGEALERELAGGPGAGLVIAPDGETAGAWAGRLDAARLDAAAPDRWQAWLAVVRGRRRLAVGTRSALLLPLPPPATLALLDEQDAAHKPPGAPRLHSRDLLRRRVQLEGGRLLLLAGAPSVESWWEARQGRARLVEGAAAPGRAEVVAAPTRGILRNHPLTLPLTAALRDALRRGGRIALVAHRRAPALGCDDCGAVPRCPDCGVALAYERTAAKLGCRLCGHREPAPASCPRCRGRRLAQLGWGPERVVAAVARRFPQAVVASATDAARAPRADVLVGTTALLRRLPPGGLDAVGIVALDDLLRLPDFRAAERAFQLLWTAVEATRPAGRVVVQTLHPDHYALRAAQTADRARFYDDELRFREELGYPPFRRLCLLRVSGADPGAARRLLEDCRAALGGVAGLVVYPPAPAGAGPARRPRLACLVKGPRELPALLAGPLGPLLDRPRRAGAVVEVEMDPVDFA